MADGGETASFAFIPMNRTKNHMRFNCYDLACSLLRWVSLSKATTFNRPTGNRNLCEMNNTFNAMHSKRHNFNNNSHETQIILFMIVSSGNRLATKLNHNINRFPMLITIRFVSAWDVYIWWFLMLSFGCCCYYLNFHFHIVAIHQCYFTLRMHEMKFYRFFVFNSKTDNNRFKCALNLNTR